MSHKRVSVVGWSASCRTALAATPPIRPASVWPHCIPWRTIYQRLLSEGRSGAILMTLGVHPAKNAVHLLALVVMLLIACSTEPHTKDRGHDSQSPDGSERTLEGWDGPVVIPSMHRTESPTQTIPLDSQPLAESRWILKTLGGLLIIPGTHLTLSIGTDGFGISDGCNSGASQGKAPHVGPDGEVSFGPAGFFQTMKLCTEPVGIMDQASRYKDALWEARRYGIEGDLLSLLDHDGEVLVTLTRVHPLRKSSISVAGANWRLLPEEYGFSWDRAPTISFLDGRLARIDTDCGIFISKYRTRKQSRIQFPYWGRVKVESPCVGDYGEFEFPFMRFVYNAIEYSAYVEEGGRRLEMRSKRHRVITLEGLSRGAVGLSDVEWELLAFVEFDIDHRGWVKGMEVEGVLPETRTTLSFHSSGMSGETDCSSYDYSSPMGYEVYEDRRFSDDKLYPAVRYTCVRSPEAVAQDRRYFKFLSRMSRSRVSGDHLVLHDNDDGLLIFQRR